MNSQLNRRTVSSLALEDMLINAPNMFLAFNGANREELTSGKVFSGYDVGDNSKKSLVQNVLDLPYISLLTEHHVGRDRNAILYNRDTPAVIFVQGSGLLFTGNQPSKTYTVLDNGAIHVDNELMDALFKGNINGEEIPIYKIEDARRLDIFPQRYAIAMTFEQAKNAAHGVQQKNELLDNDVMLGFVGSKNRISNIYDMFAIPKNQNLNLYNRFEKEVGFGVFHRFDDNINFDIPQGRNVILVGNSSNHSHKVGMYSAPVMNKPVTYLRK